MAHANRGVDARRQRLDLPSALAAQVSGGICPWLPTEAPMMLAPQALGENPVQQRSHRMVDRAGWILM